MAFRSIATLSLSFGLVSIPVKVYSATESSAAIRFKLLSRGGQRVRRRYVADEEEASVLADESDAEVVSAAPPQEAQARPCAVLAQPPSAAAPAVPALRSAASTRPADIAPAPAREPAPRDAPPAARDDPGLDASEMVKGYEFEKGRFVTFTAAELKALAGASRPTIDIVSFVPAGSVDPVYYDKAYYLAPDKPGSKPYGLLHAAMQASGRCALARWAWRAKEYVVQIRPAGSGLVLQQLLYADEVRSIAGLGIEIAEVGDAELQLALRLIEQISADSYDPRQFVDEEKQRILAAVERKIAGRKVLAAPARPMPTAQVIDLVAALRASLGTLGPPPPGRAGGVDGPVPAAHERKPARRAAKKGAPAAPSRPATPAAKRSRGRASSR